MADYDPVAMLRSLTASGVRFVVIGGVAARLHGAPLLTEDLDVTPSDDARNVEAICVALVDMEARLRVPADAEGVAFPIAPDMLRAARSWTLITRYGPLDLVFDPAGTRGYADLARDAVELRVASDPPLTISVASLADVIRTKEAAGRAKDRAALPLLRETLAEVQRRD